MILNSCVKTSVYIGIPSLCLGWMLSGAVLGTYHLVALFIAAIAANFVFGQLFRECLEEPPEEIFALPVMMVFIVPLLWMLIFMLIDVMAVSVSLPISGLVCSVGYIYLMAGGSVLTGVLITILRCKQERMQSISEID